MACCHNITGYRSVRTLLFIPKTRTVLHVLFVVLMIQRTVYRSCINWVESTWEDQDPQWWAGAGEGGGIIFTRESGFEFRWPTLVEDMSTVAEKNRILYFSISVFTPLLDSWTPHVFSENNCFWGQFNSAGLFCLTLCFNNVKKRLDRALKVISSYSWAVKVLAGLSSIVSRNYRNLKLKKVPYKKNIKIKTTNLWTF